MPRIRTGALLVVFSMLLAVLGLAQSLPPPAVVRLPVTPEYGRPVPLGAFVPPPARRLVLSHLFTLRYNPLGFQDQLRFGVQRSLYRRESAVLRDNFVYLGIVPRITPSSAKLGASLEIQPLSIFNLRMTAEWMRFFGTCGSLQSFPSPAVDYADSTMSKRENKRRRYATSGAHVMIEPSFQVRAPIGKNPDGSSRFGFIALREKLFVGYWHMALHRQDSSDERRDTVWYDASLDTLIPGDGWAIQNDLDLLFQTKLNLTVGVHYTAVRPLYRPALFRTEAEADAYRNDNGHQRLGPIIAYTFFDRAYHRFNRPTLLLIAGWYLDHRWRTGRDVNAAIPYLLLGFSFQCDFLHGLPIP